MIALYISTKEGDHSSHIKFGGWDKCGVAGYKNGNKPVELETADKTTLSISIKDVVFCNRIISSFD